MGARPLKRRLFDATLSFAFVFVTTSGPISTRRAEPDDPSWSFDVVVDRCGLSRGRYLCSSRAPCAPSRRYCTRRCDTRAPEPFSFFAFTSISSDLLDAFVQLRRGFCQAYGHHLLAVFRSPRSALSPLQHHCRLHLCCELLRPPMVAFTGLNHKQDLSGSSFSRRGMAAPRPRSGWHLVDLMRDVPFPAFLGGRWPLLAAVGTSCPASAWWCSLLILSS